MGKGKLGRYCKQAARWFLPEMWKKWWRKKKKKQGYKDRKDESIAMRIKKKRTPAQLKASRDESYGKFGSKAKKSGKINR